MDCGGLRFGSGAILATMTTILILNAVSSLLAAVGLGGLVALQERRVKRAAMQPQYVTGT